MNVFKKSKTNTTVALRDDSPVAYTKEKSHSKGNKTVLKLKTEFDDGKGTQGLMKNKQSETKTDKISKKDAEHLSSTTQTKIDGNNISQSKTVQSSYTFSATLSGTPEEIEKQKKKMQKDVEKKRKDIEKKRKKMLKKK